MLCQQVLDAKNALATGIELTGLGIEVQGDVIQQRPEDIQVLAGAGLVVGGVTALVLNAVLPTEDETAAVF